MPQKFGLLGRRLSHSYSPRIHALLGSYSYELIEKEPEELGDFLTHGEFAGLNVTIPYKEAAIPYCKQLDPLVRRVGALNTIVRREDGLHGYNTDYEGFKAVLRECGQSVKGKKVLVLGTGGASKTVAALLKDMETKQVFIVGRSTTPSYDDLSGCYGFEIIVNATPVGMYPNNGARLLQLSPFYALEGVYDLIYNPWRTDLLLQAKARGVNYCNGLPMLVAQAAASSALFTGEKINIDERESIIRSLLAQSVNITLVGMPGCGKSTVGRKLAELCSRPFIDIDEEIETKAGMTIPEIFEKQGEAVFRRMEKELLYKAGQGGGCVIATGGGAVMDEENRAAIVGNSFTVYLARRLDELSSAGRPLSKDAESIAALYHERLPYYKSCADYTVNNDADETRIAARILEGFHENIGS